MSAHMPITSNAVARFEPRVQRVGKQHMESPRQPPLVRSEVRISIDRLRIEGLNLTSRQGKHVQVAIERELARLLQAQPLRLSGEAIAGLRAPSLAVAPGVEPHVIGIEIARSLFVAMRDELCGCSR